MPHWRSAIKPLGRKSLESRHAIFKVGHEKWVLGRLLKLLLDLLLAQLLGSKL